jgi:hypothetical protein
MSNVYNEEDYRQMKNVYYIGGFLLKNQLDLVCFLQINLEGFLLQILGGVLVPPKNSYKNRIKIKLTWQNQSKIKLNFNIWIRF